VPDLDAMLAPVGGGGLLSGTAIACRGIRPGIRVIGCEPAVAADAAESLRVGSIVPARPPASICDGLLTSLGKHTFPILRAMVDEILLAEESEIVRATMTIMQRMKIVVEPSAAVTLAVVLSRRGEFAGRRVGLILSGGNVDLARLASAIEATTGAKG
ncbi:MAG: pyridoxal-phosphate dependent enzyme, partial [Phycisphaerae bacterium]|nr:pyridoxal-phosphate dependent enzyme [Phycisphaerae bacterium]